MKKLLVINLLIGFSIHSFCQDTPPAKTDYLRKAKNQKTLAWVLLGTGFSSATIGIFVGVNEVGNEVANLFSGEEQEKRSSGGALIIAGGALMVSSIPFFIAASNNKRKAATAFFKMETQPLVRQGSFIKTSYPAIALRINL